MLPQHRTRSESDPSRDVVLLRQAAAAYKAGRKDAARELLAEASAINPENELVWLWRASVAGAESEAREAIARVLALNPKNPKALQWQAKLDARRRAASRSTHGPIPVSPKPATKAEPPLAARRPAGDDPDPIRAILEEKTGAIQPAAPAEEPQRETGAVERAEDPSVAPPASLRNSIVLTEPSQASASVGAEAACPVCGRGLADVKQPCSRCRCLTDLRQCDEISQLEGAERALLQASIERLVKVADGDFDALRALAIAYLNLKRSNDALAALAKASALRPDDRTVSDALERLRMRRVILAVDDSKTIQHMIAGVLERKLHRVVLAEDGMQALARINEELPNLVLLDITMPRMDGYQVSKVITSNAETQHIPVIMLSGKDGFFDKMRGRMAGATEYITKPFDGAQLAAAVERRLSR